MAITAGVQIRRTPLLLLILCTYIASCSSFRNFETPTHKPTTTLSLSKPHRKKRISKSQRKALEYEQRKQQWMERYGSVQALQSTFGSTTGDLTPSETRRLYHTLLPRSLLGLYEMGLMKPEELAPMAYEARIAAKQYARSRCVWYARVATQLFDQYRSLRDTGRLLDLNDKDGGWEEIWSKYEAQIVREECTAALEEEDLSKAAGKMKFCNEKDLTVRIYLRILEKSTATNKAFDQIFLNTTGTTTTTTVTNQSNTTKLDQSLAQMGQQLEQDVRNILLGPKEGAKAAKKARKLEMKKAKQQRKAIEKESKLKLKAEKKQKREEKEQTEVEPKFALQSTNRPTKVPERTEKYVLDEADKKTQTTIDPQRWKVLKIMAGTRRKFRVLRNVGKFQHDKM